MEPITSPTIPPKNSYKTLFFLSLGLFLITASVLITLLIIQKSSNPTQTAQTTNIQEETEPTPTETINTETESITPTSTETTPTKSATTSNVPKDWKTYTDLTYNFSINYPSSWSINKTNNVFSLISDEMSQKLKDAGGISSIYGPEITIEFQDTQDFLSEMQVKNLEEYIKASDTDVENIILGNTNGYSVITGYPSHRIYLEKDNHIITVNDNSFNQEEYKSSFEKQVIDTIKFN